jgi:hypothetical protein
MNTTESKKSNRNLKIIIILLATAVLGSLFFTYKSQDKSRNEIISLREDRAKLLQDLEKANLVLEQLKLTNGDLNGKLAAEQKKIRDLIFKLENKQVTTKEIIVYRQKTDSIDGKVSQLMQELKIYKQKVDSTTVELTTEKIKNDTLKVVNKKLNKKLSEGSKLYYYNLQNNFYKAKNSGKLVATQTAKRVEMIVSNFMIAENQLANPMQKTFYIQIIDPKNNVIGEKGTKTFGDKIITYSSKTICDYKQKTTAINFEINVKDLEKGNYFVNIFDGDQNILNTSFVLD